MRVDSKGTRYIPSPHSADESQQGRYSRVHCCNPASSVLVVFGVSKRLSRSISLSVYCLYLYIFVFWLIRSFVDPTLAAFIVHALLCSFSLFFKNLFLRQKWCLKKGNREWLTQGPLSAILQISRKLLSIGDSNHSEDWRLKIT